MKIAQYSFSLFSGIIYFNGRKNIYRAFIAHLQTSSLKNFPPLSTILLSQGYAETTFVVWEEQYSPTLAPRVALARAQWVTSAPPLWRTYCSNHSVSLKHGKAMLTIYFLLSPYSVGFSGVATHVKRDLFVIRSKSRAHNTELQM